MAERITQGKSIRSAFTGCLVVQMTFLSLGLGIAKSSSDYVNIILLCSQAALCTSLYCAEKQAFFTWLEFLGHLSLPGSPGVPSRKAAVNQVRSVPRYWSCYSFLYHMVALFSGRFSPAPGCRNETSIYDSNLVMNSPYIIFVIIAFSLIYSLFPTSVSNKRLFKII